VNVITVCFAGVCCGLDTPSGTNPTVSLPKKVPLKWTFARGIYELRQSLHLSCKLATAHRELQLPADDGHFYQQGDTSSRVLGVGMLRPANQWTPASIGTNLLCAQPDIDTNFLRQHRAHCRHLSNQGFKSNCTELCSSWRKGKGRS
jgi:hypothetical protein